MMDTGPIQGTALTNGIPPKPAGSTWTDGQWRAIVRRDRNLLVAAAAGSGKTAVLVQRIIRRISDETDPLDVDRLLVATFTKAAANEMRHRIGAALEEALYSRPESDHLRKQLALLNRASITTLHSFCLEVIQRYFTAIELDPGFRIADETEADMLRQEALESLLEERYAQSPEDHPFWRLADWFGGDRSDEPLLKLIARLYEASRSHPFPSFWLKQQAAALAEAGGEPEKESSGAGVGADDISGPTAGELRLLHNPWLASLLRDVRLELAGAEALILEGLRLCGEPLGPVPYADALEGDLLTVRSLQEAAEMGWQTLYRCFQGLAFGKLKACKGDAYDKALQEAVKKLRSGAKDKLETLKEELFVRSPDEYFEELRELAPLMRELVDLTEGFASRYQEAKTDKGLVDFTDLEHYCLQILGAPDGKGGLAPTPAALAYREQFAEIMLDEYQDTNLVQETIVRLISRDLPGNRFMVGDVKQSIYRFRLAEPGLFLEKYRSYGTGDGAAGPGERIDLARNFRSRQEVVDGVNFLFRQIMQETVGEMDYDTDAELVCGASYPEDPNADFAAELVLIDRDGPEEAAGGEGSDEDVLSGAETGDAEALPDAGGGSAGAAAAAEEAEDLAAAQLEARYIGRRIRTMMGMDGEGEGAPFLVSEKGGRRRPAQFRDFVILLRATRHMAPVLIEELGLLGIPAYADISSGYFAATEVETILSLLKVIDNPRQDIPLAAVLRSPVVGLSADELARVRLAERAGGYYEALTAWLKQAERQLAVMEGRLRTLPVPDAGDDVAETGLAGVEEPAQLELWTSYAEAAPAAAAELAKPQLAQTQPLAIQPGSLDNGAAVDPEAAAFINMAHKLQRFWRQLEGWRQAAREGSLSELIHRIYRETGYYDYAGGLPGGVQRQANLRALYDRSRQYESTSFRGLFRFLRFVERLKDGGGDLGTARALGEQEDVVRIMSIHKSKGLEFPVVFAAGMGKRFNLMDLNGTFLIHKELGFGPKFTDEALRAVYPTLPMLAIRRRMRMETLAEEMRVLYVALTRAKEKLILLGAVAGVSKQLEKWARALSAETAALPDYMLAEARSYLDWVVPAALRHPGASAWRELAGDPSFAGCNRYAQEASQWRFSLLEASELAYGAGKAAAGADGGSELSDEAHNAGTSPTSQVLDRLASAVRALVPLTDLTGADRIGFERLNTGAFRTELETRLNWSYIYEEAASMLTKTSVSELKRLEESSVLTGNGDDAAYPVPPAPQLVQALARPWEKMGSLLYRQPRFRKTRKLSAAEIGTVYHTVMQHVPYRELPTEEAVERLLLRLEEGRILSAEERTAVQPAAIAGFFRSELGGRVAGAKQVYRELPFSYGLRAGDVYPEAGLAVADETLLIQGVIDCLFLDAEGRLVLLDYKTDRTGEASDEALAERYRLQLDLYARAIESIWRRPVDQRILYYFDGARAVPC